MYYTLLMMERKLNIDKILLNMESLGLNQTVLAKKLNVSRESVSKWIKGEKFPRPAKLLALSKQLDLSFNEIIIQKNATNPIIAFRTNKNKRVTEEQESIANDMSEMLKVLLPYLCADSVFHPPVIDNPLIDYNYIQKVSLEIRKKAGLNTVEITFNEIMKLYIDFHIILVPVMWGPNGNNGLYIHLPENKITFIYANLEKVITDFKFWLLHELAHTMTPSLDSANAEEFADSFAAAVLFPRESASKAYNELIKIRNKGTIVNRIKNIASNLLISPYTILGEMKKYAEDSSLPVLEIDMGGAITNFNKKIGLVSEIIFEEECPDAEKYIRISEETFMTEFFTALSKYLHEENKEAGIIQRLMNIPIADAKGVHKALDIK